MKKFANISLILDRKVEYEEVQYLVKVSERARSSSDKENSQFAWVKAEQVKDTRMINQFNKAATKGKTVFSIVGATPTKSMGIWFYVQWRGTFSGSWLPAALLRQEFPQELIKFYEENLVLE